MPENINAMNKSEKTQEMESKEAAEIRSEEKSRGGLSYEVILAEPAINIPIPKKGETPGKNLSVEEIEQKLKAAEDRRISLEQKKMADLSSKLTKIEEAARKKDEITNEFINQTKEQLESKMEQHVEKREAIISDLKEKLKIHSQEVEKAREQLEQQKNNSILALEEKLKTAETLREENKRKMLERLKEHNTVKITEIKAQIDQLTSQKLEQNYRNFENKLTNALHNREKEIQKKIDKVQQLERRAELVRQNKAAAVQQQSGDDTSSSTVVASS